MKTILDKELKDKINNIKMPDDFIEFTDELLSNLPEKNCKVKKHSKIKTFLKTKKGIIAASISLTLLMGGVLTNPAIASNVPILNKAFARIYTSENSVNDLGYKYNINKEVKSNGISISFKDVFIQNGSLLLNYQVISKGKIENYPGSWNSTISINGYKIKHVDTNDTSVFLKEENGLFYYDQTCEIDTSKIDLNKYSNIDILNNLFKFLNDDKNKFHISYSIKNFAGIDGNWKFNISIPKNKIILGKIIEPNKKLKFDKYEINIDKISLGSIKSKVYFSSILPKNYDTNLKCIMITDKNISYTDLGTSIGGSLIEDNKISVKGELRFSGYNETPKKIKLIPYKNSETYTDEANLKPIKRINIKEILNSKQTIDVKLNDYSNISLQNAKINNNSFDIDFKVTGPVVSFYHGFIKLVNKEGKEIDYKFANNPLIYKFDKSTRSYLINPNEDYYIELYDTSSIFKLDFNNALEVNIQ